MTCLLGAVQGLLEAQKAVQDSLLSQAAPNTPGENPHPHVLQKLLVCFREWGKNRYNHRKLKSVHDANSSLSLMTDKLGRHPCSSSDPSGAGAQGGAGNRLCLAHASGQEQGQMLPRCLVLAAAEALL